MTRLTHLECTRCHEHYAADRPQTVCPKDGGVLYARYDLASIKKLFSPASLLPLAPTMWRYDAVLPEAADSRWPPLLLAGSIALRADTIPTTLPSWMTGTNHRPAPEKDAGT